MQSKLKNIEQRTNPNFEKEQMEEAKEKERLAQEMKSLDLMFIMDCTGSMSTYLNRCKDEIYDITENI